MATYTSTLRMHEVGIRLTLGASTQDVTSVILRSSVIPLAVGLTAGIGAALLLSRFLSSILYEIRGNDLVTYLAAALLLLTVGTFASARPAWRAATGDPLKALRAE